MNKNLPTIEGKPSLLDYLEQYLPFTLPRIPLPQTAKNLDKAAARLLDAGSANLAARMAGSTARIKARSQAEGEFIAAGTKAATDLVAGDPALAERAMRHALGAAVREQQNREAVLEIAAEELAGGEAQAEAADAEREIDEDWLNQFSQFAAQKENRDIQTLWGKILAGEIRQPGSFSLRTLAHLATITSEEANFIHSFMPLVIDGQYIFHGIGDDFIAFDDAMRLEDLGVLINVGGAVARSVKMKAGEPFRTFLHNMAVEVICKKDSDFPIRNVYPLSSFGMELFKLCSDLTTPKAYFEAVVRSFVSKNRTVYALELGPKQGDRYPVRSKTQIE